MARSLIRDHGSDGTAARHQSGPANDIPDADADWKIRLRRWRTRQIASPSFRKLMARLPLGRWLSNRKANGLFRLISGFVHAKVLGACVHVGLFDTLRDRCMTTPELALRCDLPEDRMGLLLAQASRLGLVLEVRPGRWMLDDAGAVIAGDPGLRAMIRHHDLFYRDLEDPVALLKDRKPDSHLSRYWGYVHGTRIDDLGAGEVAAYSALMRDSQAMLADCILGAHDFGRYESLLDLGGGDGAFLAAAGSRHPDLTLHLFDLPPVAARAKDHLADLGLDARAEVHGGDFACDPIPGNADCVSLVRILCDHDDDRVRRILANLHASLRPGTRVIVAEAMEGSSDGGRLAAVYFDFYFLAMGSGRCRSDARIKDLLTEAGFKGAHTRQTATPLLATLVIAER